MKIGEVEVFRNGAPVPFDPDALRRVFGRPTIDIELRLGIGQGEATAWGTDLSAEYVRINADYTT